MDQYATKERLTCTFPPCQSIPHLILQLFLHNAPVCSFYQHVKDKPNWDWGILWGHASSEDLVQWTRMPTALTPSPRGADTSGCWSGCVTFDKTGQAHALYTGARG